MDWLEIYILGYSAIILSYLWFRFFLITTVRDKQYDPVCDPVSVVVPCFNEDPIIVEQSIQSILDTDGEKEIFLIDDGSKIETKKGLRILAKKYPITYIEFEKNKGKRHAQYEGFKLAKYPYIITLDSDTKLFKDSIREIIKPFSDPKVGAVTCVLELWNKNENLFTKILNGRYINAFRFERVAQSRYGGMNCCFGGFSAYRTSVVKENLETYITQKFLGVDCTFGDDRHLTNLILKTHTTVCSEKARAITVSPSSPITFIRQQTRWIQSFTRENLLTLKYSWQSKKWVLFGDTLTAALMPFLSLGIRILMIISVIMYPISLIYYILIIATMAFVRNITVIVDSWSEIWYCILYGLLHAFVIYWIYYIALYKLFITRKNGWITR